MRFNVKIDCFLLVLFSQHILGYFNDILTKNVTIAHPETGLFLSYVGLYRPSDAIVHNTAIFPMTVATCHFLPLSAALHIPACNITIKRHKRLLTDIISLGIGVTSLAMTTANSIQISNLNHQVALVEKSLSEFSHTMKIHGAQLAKIQETQIQLAEELQITQRAINAIIPILDWHSQNIEVIKFSMEKIHTQFQHSFLYLAIKQIFRNQLTLDFLSPDDLHNVIYDVMIQGNLTFTSEYGSLPLAQIITNLLVRQQVDFIPSSRYETKSPDEIGRLVITSYFAVPQREHTSFHVYKLLPIPFVHQNKTMQLTQIPQYWAVNTLDNTTMEWHDSQASGCDLQAMATCRDNPPILSMSDRTCLAQILGGLPLSKCQTALVAPEPFFLRQLRDNLWVISSPEPLHCLKILSAEHSALRQQTWNINSQLLLPPVALVNVTPGYTIACPGFTLVGHHIPSSAPSLVVLYNNSLLSNNISIVNIDRYLRENTSWFSVKSREQKIDDIIKRMHEPIAVPVSEHPKFHLNHTWYFGASVFSWIFIGLILFVIYYVYRFKRKQILQNI
ncbi:unnamed protein product [Adineta ricciae]|uniref:Envelope fusion glycoprotein n=1 Tax=Adineta ricciae TaxID=249248 RepID=A0A815T4C5_ADIRI|nr:unnamed protein product [Adineta ricciae]CAF1498187.1 unnamed protein product [Adineta ricciae]